MSGIGGPGGIGGPKGPGGPQGPDGPDGIDGPDGVDGVDAPDGVDGPDGASGVDGPSDTADIDRLAAEVAAGRLTPREAIDQLVEATATPDLSPAERAELREMLTDLVANDPYFGGLANRV
ncbi:MAG: flagellar protein FliT [Kofleriaceae bacterium]